MTVRPVVIFRCNASATVGMGHLMRSRTFAAELRKHGRDCVMVGPSNDYRTPADNELFIDWAPENPWTSGKEDALAFMEIARAHGATHAVIDDYRADEPFQDVLAEAGLVWMQHFDASKERRFRADMLVHGSPSETEQHWRPNMLNPDGEMLFGPQYSILRPEFPPANLRPDQRDVRQILVSFGGGDDMGAIRLTLDALVDLLPDVRFAVMSGAHNPNNAAIKSWIANHCEGRVTLHVQPPEVAGLFAACDLALLGGGTSIYEAASCGLPMVLTALADNQLRQCEAWEKMGAAVFLGPVAKLTPDALRQTVTELVDDGSRRANMSSIGRNAVDGRGAARLAAHLLKDRSK